MILPGGILSFLVLSSCAYQLPPQPTAFITRQEPDRLSDLLSQHPLPKGKVAVLGGQILRRYDSPVGRYFLIRDLPLDQDAYPHPSKGKILVRSNDEFVLFTPALHIIGEHRAKKRSHQSSSAFIVFGQEQNQTVSMGPGHIITAVGEVRGMAPFPTEKKHHHYLLLVSQYVMLWSQARPEDYPLVPKMP
jgi:starvation-inducible outer membrane lipoprotein